MIAVAAFIVIKKSHRLKYECIPYGLYVVRYTIHDAHAGTIAHQTLEAFANTIEEAQKIKAPSSGHVVSILVNLRKFYRARR